ncbi:hypothetical protein [uncultured Polaribacter sp.]|uniref:hypothetical protein n=1 Tax=uncultured Polaribacter sp. TaxID=174711 RepID=UPI00259BA41E|nr:hypothetical protein [uncultured Polaribacter sp.]
MIEIFCNVPELIVRNMKAVDITDICNTLNKMFDVKHQLITSFKIDDVEYAFIPSLEDMTFGEYVDLDTYIGDNDNLHRALNVLYRPIEFKTGNRYTIKEYNPDTSEIAKRFPVDAVLGSIVFFYTLGADLSKAMMNSSKKQNENNLVQYLTSQQDMDGIIQSMDSLTEILQNLNISPN